MSDSDSELSPPVLPAGVVGSWQLEPGATSIEFHTKAMWGLVSVSGSFQAVGGSGSVSADGFMQGEIVIDATTITTMHKRRDKHLRSMDFFGVDRYPTFSYTVDGAITAHDGQLTVIGELLIKGTSLPTVFIARITQLTSQKLVLRAQAEVDRQEWGMTWAKRGAGVINQIVVIAAFARM